MQITMHSVVLQDDAKRLVKDLREAKQVLD